MGGGRSILLIEDDALTGEAFAILLEGAGFSVVGPLGWSDDATLAIDLTQVDAAVVDVNLHGVKCFALMDKLEHAGIPTEAVRKSKAIWKRHGALDVRLNQIFTGPFTGQWLVATLFPDMATYAKAQAAVAGTPEMQKLLAQNVKDGAALHERTILIGTDL